VTKEFVESKKAMLYRVSDGYRLMGKIFDQDGKIFKDQVAEIQKHKLCESVQDYNENHMPLYSDPCPLLKVCFKAKLADKLEKARKRFNNQLG
jgi:hypothetical protein